MGKKKAETSVANYLRNFQSILVKVGILLRLTSVMKLILILSHPFNIQGREGCLYDFVR